MFRHGTVLHLRGSAFDEGEGELPGSALTWRIVLHHGSHIHLVMSGVTGAEQSFILPGDHDADSY